MSDRIDRRHAEDEALRAAGYARLPRLLVPKELHAEIVAAAERFGAEVKKIKREAMGKEGKR